MILPATMRFNQNYRSISKNNLKQKQVSNSNDCSRQLSGLYNPIKSYITFGWCTAHYQAMYEIDEKFSQKINTKLKQIENLKNTHEERKKRYSIVDNAALEAGRILAQYANMQCVIAEVPPSYSVITAPPEFIISFKSSIFSLGYICLKPLPSTAIVFPFPIIVPICAALSIPFAIPLTTFMLYFYRLYKRE